MNIAFIPVRGGSKSIPLKNIKELNGKPLVYWTIKAAEEACCVDKIIVATDSDEIKQVVKSFEFDKVEIYDRDSENAQDTSSTESVMLEYIVKSDLKKEDNFILIQATSPLLKSEDIDGMYETLINSDADSIFSGVREKQFHWIETEHGVKPINYDYRNRPRRQDFAGIIAENGACYINSVGNILKDKCRLSGKIITYEMSSETAYEIDEKSDWLIVEELMKNKKMSYENAIEKLTSQERFHINVGLDRISKVLTALGNPQDQLEFIHVAGTNGKGSVCAMLNSILQEAGYKTGLYTSPHIFEYTERIKINSEEISKEDFVDYFKEVMLVSEKFEITLTEFEILTAMMFLYFARNKVEIVILETGLGGRLDATNVIKNNLCSIITQIDLDHTDRLGTTKDEIAYEKAGIIKQDCPVITSMGYEEIRDKADEMNSMLIFTSSFVQQDFVEALSLKGLHQVENLALVISAINYLFKDINEKTIIEGLKKVENPYRFEYFEDKNLIIDACHNPNGAKALRENLDYFYPNEKRRFIFGALKTKDYAKMMEVLFQAGDEVYLNEFDYPQACSYEELKSACPVSAKKYNGQDFGSDKLNIICGSFYMIGKIIC